MEKRHVRDIFVPRPSASSKRGADPGSARTGLSPIFRALNSSADSTILTILNVRVWVCAWHAGLEWRRERARRFFGFHAVSHIRQRRFGKRRLWRVTTRAKSAESSRTAVAPTCCSSKPSAADHSERARSRPGTRVRDVAVRRAGDRHGHEGAGRGEDPGSAPGGGVVQRHDGEERAVRGERSRGCGQVREAAHLLEHGQAARRRGGGAGGDQGGAAEVGQPNGAAHDRGAFAPSFRAPYSSRASGLEFSSREVLAASRDARKSSTPDSPPPLAHRRLAPPPSSPRRCTRGSASGKSSAEAGA